MGSPADFVPGAWIQFLRIDGTPPSSALPPIPFLSPTNAAGPTTATQRLGSHAKSGLRPAIRCWYHACTAGAGRERESATGIPCLHNQCARRFKEGSTGCMGGIQATRPENCPPTRTARIKPTSALDVTAPPQPAAQSPKPPLDSPGPQCPPEADSHQPADQ